MRPLAIQSEMHLIGLATQLAENVTRAVNRAAVSHEHLINTLIEEMTD